MTPLDPIHIVNRAMCAGGDEEILRRVINRLLEAYRVDNDIPFEKFYDVPKDDHTDTGKFWRETP